MPAILRFLAGACNFTPVKARGRKFLLPGLAVPGKTRIPGNGPCRLSPPWRVLRHGTEQHTPAPFVWVLRVAATDTIAKFVAWSQRSLDKGVWPHVGFGGESFLPKTKRHRRKGTPLANGLRAHYALWQGDLKARKEIHRFKRQAQSGRMCDACGAVQLFADMPEHLNYANFEDTAGYVYTQLSHLVYLLTEMVKTAWCSVPGFVIESLLYDFMHVSMLGVERDAAAAYIIDMIEAG